MNTTLIKSLIVGFLTHFQIRPRVFLVAKRYYKFAKELRRYSQQGGEVHGLAPRLFDASTASGEMSGAYFHHDLLVAQFIHEREPTRHLDVGSRIDGFVAHVAAFRKIDVIDIRYFTENSHPNITTMKLDFIATPEEAIGKADSVSCLNTLEHFGLGRYGDDLDPNGHLKGFAKLANALSEGGHLYLAIPISQKARTYFNSHRIFLPDDALRWAAGQGLSLIRFDYIDDRGFLHQEVETSVVSESEEMGFGLYTFTRGSRK